MKKSIMILIFIIFIISLTASQAFALRCNGSLVCVGDRTYIVLKRCGEPVYKEIIRIGIKKPKVEHWVYGPISGYYRYLIFKDGKLFKIESHRK